MNQALTISLVDLPVFECRSISEFKGFVLEYLVDKAAIKRDLDFEPTLELIYSRLKIEGH